MRIGLLLAAICLCLCVPSLAFSLPTPAPLVTVEDAEAEAAEEAPAEEVLEPAPVMPVPQEALPGASPVQPTTLESVYNGYAPHLDLIGDDLNLTVARYWFLLLAADAATILGSILSVPIIGPAVVLVFPLAFVLISPFIHMVAYENFVGAGLSLLTRLLLPVAASFIGVGIDLAVNPGAFLGGLAGFLLGGLVGIVGAMIIDYVFFAAVDVPEEEEPRAASPASPTGYSARLRPSEPPAHAAPPLPAPAPGR